MLFTENIYRLLKFLPRLPVLARDLAGAPYSAGGVVGAGARVVLGRTGSGLAGSS